MAINQTRSMNADLHIGADRDGKTKVQSPDRGGDVEVQADRASLPTGYYGEQGPAR